jgi:glutaminyl-tRNA synthetase
VKDEKTGAVVEIRCSYDPETKSGTGTSQKKVKGTIHWVSAQYGKTAQVNLYDRLFTVEDPAAVKDADWRTTINPHSLEVIPDAKIEPALADAKPGDNFQFERVGYFCVDKDSNGPIPVFNRTVPLRDSWAKIEKNLKK